MGSTDTTGAKVGSEQLIHTEHVQRQNAVSVIESIAIVFVLVAMIWPIGGIVVQSDLLGRLVIAVEAIIDHDFVDCKDCLLIHLIFKTRVG